MALTKVPFMVTMATRTTGIWPTPKIFWVDRRPGGTWEVRMLWGTREAQTLGGVREEWTLGGAREAPNWMEPAEIKVSWTGPAEAKVNWTGPVEAKVRWTGPAEAKVSWTGPTLGGALEALTLVGTRVVLGLGGALEALNWNVPAGTKVSWTGPAEAKVSWTGPTLGGARVALTFVGTQAALTLVGALSALTLVGALSALTRRGRWRGAGTGGRWRGAGTELDGASGDEGELDGTSGGKGELDGILARDWRLSRHWVTVSCQFRLEESESSTGRWNEIPSRNRVLRSLQLDPGLPDRQKPGGQNGQQHLISPDPQHWCSSRLHPQPTPVLPVHT